MEKINDKINEKFLFVMVGLPATGKSYISNKLRNFLTWRCSGEGGKKREIYFKYKNLKYEEIKGANVALFNVGNIRRATVEGNQSSDFFSAENREARNVREMLALNVLSNALDWLEKTGNTYAIFDATNTTNERRQNILKFVKQKSPDVKVVFIESICNREDVLKTNCIQKVTHSPDYKDMPLEEALEDLHRRIENYRKVYEPIENDDESWIKMINLQSRIICNRIRGCNAHVVVSFLMSLHLTPRVLYLTRTGHSGNLVLNGQNEKDVKIRMPGLENKYCDISEKGKEFSHKLAKFVRERVQQEKFSEFEIHSSILPRAIQTAEAFATPFKTWALLNMFDLGPMLSGLTLEEIREAYPEEYQQWSANKRNYKFLNGTENYNDFIKRLEPFVLEMERTEVPCVVVTHHSTIQVLRSYFMGIPFEESFQFELPLDHILEIKSSAYGWTESVIKLN